ncbi:HD domain-containing protein [Butyrivibrio sp. YAB3001]|nr:HD domain-containing protein [Butyrivibrio sp. YAB3001]
MDIMLSLSAACFSFALLLLFTKVIERKRRLILINMECIAGFLLLFDRMAYVFSGDVSRTAYVMVRVSNFAVFFFTSGIVFGFNLYLMNLLMENSEVRRIPVRIKFVTIGSLLGMLLVIVSQFTGFIYSFDEYNVYHRGSGFLISYIIPIVCPLIQYTVIRQYKKKFRSLIYLSLVLYIYVPIIMGIVQIFQYGVSIVNMAMACVSLSLYIFTYLDINAEVVRAHQIEIGELKEGEMRLKRLFDQTAEAFVKVVEKKDISKKGHSTKVANLARKIAERSGKDPEKCEEVYYAALLHEIGVIGIPDSIIEKEGEYTKEELAIVKKKSIIGGDILSGILEYPYIKEGVKYYNEKYDGSGYPEGLKGEEIPDAARIIAVADAFATMTTARKYHEALPYLIVREEFIEAQGTLYDPEYAQIMVQIIDEESRQQITDDTIEKELVCNKYKDAVTHGIHFVDAITEISFTCKENELKSGQFSAPSIILFDSFDGHFHDNPKAIDAFHYQEYGEVWFDGHYVTGDVRNMEVKLAEDAGDELAQGKNAYKISTVKLDDHMQIIMKSKHGEFEVLVALSDNTKEAYLALTGENCTVQDINVIDTGKKISEADIERIADRISFIDRIESDVKNVQVDKYRSAHTNGIKIKNTMRINFHSMTLPLAGLVWHCPYIVLFYSEDGKVGGEGYKEYAVIKINGEIEGDDPAAHNSFSMKKKEAFPGWDKWKEICKEGIECKVLINKKGNKVYTETENLGIAIENTTTINDDNTEVYVALTGDIVALTDIRVNDY